MKVTTAVTLTTRQIAEALGADPKTLRLFLCASAATQRSGPASDTKSRRRMPTR
ncbi:hypothetical protein [Nocardia barduliensis]|uniref:hypothetical protein n=1 Tax=Nocardia barduliensis TaxID=2736643 RepID=UPI001572B59D|nr:hypothetical protein [Nocardia barduliensis]